MDIKYTFSKIKEYGIPSALKKIYNRLLLNMYPETINVEIMTFCNLRCKHCRVSYHGNIIPDVEIGMMDFDLFKRIVDRISLLIKYAFIFQFSTVEPLLHKKIFEMMDYVLQYNRHISYPLLTNGMLLNENNILNLCSRNVPSITISLDGYKKETVEYFKTGADFNKIVNNIKLIRKVAKRQIKIYTVFVATTINISELIEYVDFCADLGVDGINVNGFFSFLPESSHLYLYSKNGNPEVYELFWKAFKKAKEEGIFIKFPSLTAYPRGCSLTSYMFISEKADVSPCMFLARRTPFELFGNTKVVSAVLYGNLLYEDPFFIWNRNEFIDFRNKLRRAEIPDECTLCADAYGVICSNRKLVP